MSAAYLKWQRIVNQLRFLYGDLRLTQEICDEAAGDFQAYYNAFCEEHGIDIRALMAEAYKAAAPPSDPLMEHALPSEDKALAAHEDTEDSAEFDKLLEEAAETHEEDSLHKAFYKVFKQLAKKLHPDRQPRELSSEEKEKNMKLFKEAKEALDERRYFVLLDLGQQYGIELPTNYRDQIKWMGSELTKVRNKIHDRRQTVNYRFSDCETDDERDELVKMVLRQHYNYSI
tara:strand:- start:780 stop:1469 length:690 start_codon:yes stop_codon:yes gene_type:complete